MRFANVMRYWIVDGDDPRAERRQAVGIVADSVQFLAARQTSEETGEEQIVGEEAEAIAF